MKSLRKTLHESRLKTHQQVRAWLQPKMGAIGTKYRLAARIRLANAWATKHPKRTLAFVLMGNIWISGAKQDQSNELEELNESNISMVSNMEPLFTGFHTIQANKDIQRNRLMDLVAQGQELREELDSMIAVPHKSRMDSTRIIQRYRQLENIVKSLNNNESK
ncbi:hypothetical protein [uncultured Bacteroides sp.]|uniref:hypothetical protein n=1 Tax=uncultured Bacteroides sp. TaxID=162156 RepID=UPI00260306A1|nr:hypothetical protein [uncultured Bacteroides sp.]